MQSLHILTGKCGKRYLFLDESFHCNMHVVLFLANMPRVFLIGFHVFFNDSCCLLIFTAFVVWAKVLWIEQIPLLDEE